MATPHESNQDLGISLWVPLGINSRKKNSSKIIIEQETLEK